MHFGSRVQSVEECPTVAHLEHVSWPRHEVCECPNLWHLKQRRGFGMYGRILQLSSISSGTPKRGTTSRLTGADSLLPPVYSEAWAKGNAEGHQSPPKGRSVCKGNAKDPQNTLFLLTGRRTRQTSGLKNQRC
ncbi:hypothetical protein TNCV_222991 [Trichonephila clavipes]|nr:hypothetical protein TNCV_222991 [Trichonephila clavipes]